MDTPVGKKRCGGPSTWIGTERGSPQSRPEGPHLATQGPPNRADAAWYPTGIVVALRRRLSAVDRFLVDLFLVVGLGAGLGAQTSSPPTRPARPAPALDDFLADIRQLTAEVRMSWSYLEYRTRESGVDLAALEAEALATVRKTPTERGFAAALARYSAGLKDGHSSVIYGNVVQFGFHRLPLSLVDTREGVMVFDVHAPVAKRGTLRPGDLLLSIDDKPIEEIIRETERVIPASTDGARRQRAIQRICRYTHEAKVRMRVRRSGGEREGTGEADVNDEVEVEVDCPLANVAIARHHLAFHKREWKMIGDGDIAFFRPASFSPPRDGRWAGAGPQQREEILKDGYGEYSRIFREILARKPKAMILDLRKNPGGTDLLGQRLVSHLVEPGFVYFRLQSKSPLPWGGWRRPSTHKPRNVPEKLPRFLGRLVVLIDEDVFSTADNVAACLRDVHPDVAFVGRSAGAGTGAPRAFTLKRTGAKVWFCTQRVYSPKGKMIEGHGVTPDVKVEWTREDYLGRRDPDLEAALRIARNGR